MVVVVIRFRGGERRSVSARQKAVLEEGKKKLKGKEELEEEGKEGRKWEKV